MSDDAKPDQSLHLPSLVIKNFRGIDELTIPRLGRVTLLAGQNGVGKTTVLDAVRIWTTRGNRFDIAEMLHERDEESVRHNADEMVERFGVKYAASMLDWDGLFYGRDTRSDRSISIGLADGSHPLSLRWVRFTDEERINFERKADRFFSEDEVWGLESAASDSRRIFHPGGELMPSILTRQGPATTLADRRIKCIKLGPNVPSNALVERYLNEIALTEQEEHAIQALNITANAPVERVALVDHAVPNWPRWERRVLAKLADDDKRVPLSSLGDGAVRTFAVALALANSTDGFLLIDEAENGIHHSIQPKFWNMVLQTAQRNNVQVLATTHSWDCVKGFAQAANELEDIEGILVRLERVPIGLRAITYDESRLEIAARSNIEVR